MAAMLPDTLVKGRHNNIDDYKLIVLKALFIGASKANTADFQHCYVLCCRYFTIGGRYWYYEYHAGISLRTHQRNRLITRHWRYAKDIQVQFIAETFTISILGGL